MSDTAFHLRLLFLGGSFLLVIGNDAGRVSHWADLTPAAGLVENAKRESNSKGCRHKTKQCHADGLYRVVVMGERNREHNDHETQQSVFERGGTHESRQ